MGFREDRIAENEVLFRNVNESVVAAAERNLTHKTDPRGFVCECGYMECTKVIYLSNEQYRAVRDHPARFFVHPGHEIAGVEEIVEEHRSYFVVEKIGSARDVAIERAED